MSDCDNNNQQVMTYQKPIKRRDNKVRLDFNENGNGCSPRVIQAINKISAPDISTYPEYEYYQQKIEELIGLTGANILLTNGSDEAIKLVFETFLTKDDEIILPVPSFSMYEFYSRNSGLNVKKILYNQDLTFPKTRVRNSISKSTKLVVIVNPNNPTGTVISNTEIIQFLHEYPDVIFLVDEAYFEFYNQTVINEIQEYENLIVLRTFSKAYGLAGLRIGYIASDPGNITQIQKVVSPYNVNTIACIAALEAMRDKNYLKKIVHEVIHSREYLTNQLRKLGFKVYPSEANFILVDFGRIKDYVVQSLVKRNILVRDRSTDPLLQNCVRITIINRKTTIYFLQQLEDILDQKSLIFDMDGVLIDVTNSYREVIKQTVYDFTNKMPTDEEIDVYKESGGYNNDWELTANLINKYGKILEQELIIDHFQKLYLGDKEKDGLNKNENWLMNKNILEQLSKTYRLGIFTGRPRDEAVLALEKFSVKNYFDVIISMDECSNKTKPDPYGLILVKQLMKSENIIYFGDNIDDIKAANSINIPVYGIIPPKNQNKQLESILLKGGAEYVFDDINQAVKEVIL